MDKKLKIFALEYVKLQDDLSGEEKISIAEFVMEASDDQVLFMLLSGEVKDSLTEKEIEFVRDNEESVLEWAVLTNKEIMTVLGAGAYLGVAAGVFVASLAVLANRGYKRYVSKAGRSCMGKSGEERTSCVKRARREAKRQKIKFMEQGLVKCAKTKSPSQCKAKLREKITREKAQLGDL